MIIVGVSDLAPHFFEQYIRKIEQNHLQSIE